MISDVHGTVHVSITLQGFWAPALKDLDSTFEAGTLLSCFYFHEIKIIDYFL